jgi:hypothetical protein
MCPNDMEVPGMTLNARMTEGEFIKAIDENVYLATDQDYEEAARVGCAISDNAALMVGYQLAAGEFDASPETNLRILEMFEKERPTPVVLAAIPVIKSLLNQEPVPGEETRKLLEACKEHGNAWCGLGIVLCADMSLEKECEQIMAGWRRSHGFPEEH